MSIQLLPAVSNWIFYMVACFFVCAGVMGAVVYFSSMFKQVMD